MFDFKRRDVRTGADLGPAQALHWAEFSAWEIVTKPR